MSSGLYKVIAADAYYKELLRACQRAKGRIVLSAMIGLWDEMTASLFAAITDAAARGVRVNLVFDTFTKLPIAAGPFSLGGSKFRTQLSKTLSSFDEIRAAGGAVTLVNTVGLNPYRGRYHPKITVVDTTVYSFGGVNVTDGSFMVTDYMLRTTSASIADYLEQLVLQIVDAPPPRDISHTVDAHQTILFDAGRPEKSIIYDTACTLSAQASEVVYVSQMCPSGRLARLLKETNYHCYFNRPEQPHFPASMAQAFDQHRWRIANNYTGKEFIHAKYMLFTLKDGSKALLSGSHNFSWRGVSYGTQEIALYSTDARLWQQLFDFTKKVVTN